MITTRRINPEEWELYKWIRLAALREAPYAFSSTYQSASQRTDESWREQTEGSASGSDRAIFISFTGDEPVGLAALYRLAHQSAAGELLQVWVDPAFRGSRAARHLLDTLFSWAKENGYQTMMAKVSNENTAAIRFYLSYGFSIPRAEDDSQQQAGEVTLVKELTKT